MKHVAEATQTIIHSLYSWVTLVLDHGGVCNCYYIKYETCPIFLKICCLVTLKINLWPY